MVQCFFHLNKNEWDQMDPTYHDKNNR